MELKTHLEPVLALTMILQWPFSNNILWRCINFRAECHSCWLISRKLAQIHFVKFYFSRWERYCCRINADAPTNLSLIIYRFLKTKCWKNDRLKRLKEKSWSRTNLGAECHSCRLISHKLHAARRTTSTKKPSGQVSLRKELLQLKCVNIIDPAEKPHF